MGEVTFENNFPKMLKTSKQSFRKLWISSRDYIYIKRERERPKFIKVKLLKSNVNDKVWKQKMEKEAFTFKRAIRMMHDISVVTMVSRKQWKNIFKVLKISFHW